MNNQLLASTVRDYAVSLGVSPGKFNSPGQVGIELEAEGVIHPIGSNYWYTENDGSLRNNGKEYILKSPIKLDKVDEALTEFSDLSQGFVFDNSPRTSCHIHWNVQKYTQLQVYAIIGAYWMFEDILVEYCGPTRIGNLFCLRASDARNIVASVLYSLQSNRLGLPNYLMGFSVDTHKYAALNLASISKLGSIEFRSMRGIYKKKEIKTWVDILTNLVSTAVEIGSPSKIYELFKELSPDELVNKFFGEYSDIVKAVPHWKPMIKSSSFFLGQLANVCAKAEKEEVSKSVQPKIRTTETSTWAAYSPSFTINHNFASSNAGRSTTIGDNNLPLEMPDELVVQLHELTFFNGDL